MVATVLIAVLWWMREPVIERPPGVLVVDPPTQRDVVDPSPIRVEDHVLTPVARFSLSARVLGREDYRFDRGARLSPTDLALGWQKMSDSAVLETLTIRQSNRFYFWRAAELPIPQRDIERMSANMHLVPANAYVAGQINAVRRGDLVDIDGLLVDASGPDGWQWSTSRTRDDTGNGACELVWVKQLRIRPRP